MLTNSSMNKSQDNGSMTNKAQFHSHETAGRVINLVVEHLAVDAGRVTESAHFIYDLGGDSLDVVELVMAFEEEFGLQIPDEAAEKITTVKDAIEYLNARMA